MTEPDPEVVAEIVGKLTEAQRETVLLLDGDWLFGGYDSSRATILWALDAILMQPALVEQRLTHPVGRYPRYEHRLTPLGLAVRKALQEDKG